MAIPTLVSMPLQVAAGQQNACAITSDPVAPEFLVSLNTCTPKEKVQKQLPENDIKTIEAILEHVFKRLGGSLDPIWDGCDYQNAEWAPRKTGTPQEHAAIEAEEIWARWCTELMVATGYGGVSEYGSEHFDDERFFRAFEDAPWNRVARKDQVLDAEEVNRPPNPVVPVKMACQQLCTYAYYSRGLLFDEVMSQKKPVPPAKPAYGVTASANGHLSHLFKGGWDTSSKYADIQQAFARAKGPIGPGSILGFLPEGAVTQTKGSHVVFVLRVAPSLSRAQFFDTGAVLERADATRSKDGRRTPKAADAFNGGNYDDRLFGGLVGVWNAGTSVKCVGFGALLDTSPSKILGGVAMARKARPLGMARLAILKRTWDKDKPDDRILYISPRTWMHDTGSDANYYISRFLWSLRETPGYENIEVLWQISHPANGGSDLFASEAFKAPRSSALKDVWGIKKDRPHTGFLTMSNNPQGESILRQRVKLQPKKTKGQRLQLEGGHEYDAIIEYDYTVTQADDSEKRYSVRGAFAMEPGKALLAKPLADQPFRPPPFFAPW